MENSYHPPEPSFLRKDQIWTLAESVAEQLSFKPGDDIHALVSRLGGSVQVQDMLTRDPETSGTLYVDAPDRFRIVVPSHTSISRDNFTIAHELGHYFVHYLWHRKHKGGHRPPMIAYRKESERLEWEANWFAAAFLMPKKKFLQEYRRSSGRLPVLASSFGVSVRAAEVRARQLGAE